MTMSVTVDMFLRQRKITLAVRPPNALRCQGNAPRSNYQLRLYFISHRKETELRRVRMIASAVIMSVCVWSKRGGVNVHVDHPRLHAAPESPCIWTRATDRG